MRTDVLIYQHFI